MKTIPELRRDGDRAFRQAQEQIMSLTKQNSVLQSKNAKQKTEIARLTQRMESATEHIIRLKREAK